MTDLIDPNWVALTQILRRCWGRIEFVRSLVVKTFDDGLGDEQVQGSANKVVKRDERVAKELHVGERLVDQDLVELMQAKTASH